MAIFPISYLRDNFENNVIDAAWSTGVTGSATAAETGGQAVLTLPSSTAGSHVAYYIANAKYDLTGDQCAISIGTMVATGVAATAAFQLYLDANNIYKWTQTSGTLKAQKIVAGVTTDLFSVAWSASTHKYLRIRESGGTVFFDTSTSASAGAAWTNRGSTTIAAAFAVTDLYVQFFVSCGNIASPGSLRLDMFNLVLPTPTRTWRWTDADWQIVNRMRPVTLASSGNKQGVLVTAGGKDAAGALTGTLRYFAGPVGSSSGGYAALTEYASLALAQANPFDIPINGRIDLPSLVDARIMRLYHSSDDGASGVLREYFPRRITQSDDIEAENIDGMVIRANTLSADKIIAHSITATQIGVVNLDASAYITAGAGRVKLDANGMAIVAATRPSLDFEVVAQLNWKLANGTYVGWISAVNDNSQGASVLGIGVDDPASATAPIWVYNNLVQLNFPLRMQDAIRPLASAGSAAFGLDYTSSTSITIANNGTATPFGNANNFAGAFVINPSTVNGATALVLTGGGGVSIVGASVANVYSTVQGTASRINVYLTVGNVLTIENKLGASVTMIVAAQRTRSQQ